VVLQSVCQRPVKVQHVAVKNKVERLSALVCQHTTQLLLPRIDKRIDDLQYENYNVPTFMYGERKLIMRDRYHQLSSGAYQHVETDYEDARIEKEYEMHEHTFRDIHEATELTKLSKLNDMLEKMLRNKNVSNKQMQSNLTAEEYANYITSLDLVSHSAENMYGDGMPSELRDYNTYVRRADFQNNKFEKMHGEKTYRKKNYSSASITAASNKAESLYENALERLGEIWGVASSAERFELQNWMDREIDLDGGANTKLSIDCVGIPRVRGSKSKNALDSGLPKLSKRLKRKECQLQALRSAACAIAFEAEVVEEVTISSSVLKNKLQDLLKLCDDY
jgi:hypothetical protein